MDRTTLTISLPADLQAYVEQQVASGHYRSPEDYLRALIRADEERQEQARTDHLLLEGLASGAGRELKPEDWQDLRAKVRQRIKRGENK